VDERYLNPVIQRIWSNEHKLKLWQDVELAVIQAMAKKGLIKQEDADEIERILRSTPIDIEWWKAEDKRIHHDYNAFVHERIRHLPARLQKYFHMKITSFDGEEAPFSTMIAYSGSEVRNAVVRLLEVLKGMALRYRYTPMMGVTHGQSAEPMTFGKRNLSWYQDCENDLDVLDQALKRLVYSKISGAVGGYGASIDPNMEKAALEKLGKVPFYGATQIMPREIYAPVAEAICQIVMTLEKIAKAIRLGARSPRPIYQEPFSKTQKGSSTMPHKKNTIRTEQIEGMARMALGYLQMIMQNISTWEERAIEQSCVERVAWPDLFHVAVHSLKVMINVMTNLKVYPDNMLREIFETRGCYASSEAKEFIRDLGVKHGLEGDDGYNIIQLAAFMAHGPTAIQKNLREKLPASLAEMDSLANLQGVIMAIGADPELNIQNIIQQGRLKTIPDLEITEEEVEKWNGALLKIFSSPENCARWDELFKLSTLLKNEKRLFYEVFNV